jgi:hypothetical protein
LQIPGPLVQVQGEASISLIASDARKGIFLHCQPEVGFPRPRE